MQKLRLPDSKFVFPVPNTVTGFGLKQDNLDRMVTINLIPANISAFETPERVISGTGTANFAGTRKIWADRTASPDGARVMSYWEIERDEEGNAVKYQAPKSVTDSMLATLGDRMTQQSLSVYRQYAAWLPYIPALKKTAMVESEARRLSFSDFGVSPQIPLFQPPDLQGPWMYFFAETVGDAENAGEIYAVDYQAFVKANPLDYSAPYKPPASGGIPTRTPEQQVQVVNIIAEIMKAAAPRTKKYEQIVTLLMRS